MIARVRRRHFYAAGALAVVALAAASTKHRPRPPSAPPARGFAFAVLGDAPYFLWEEAQFRLVLRDIAAHDLAWAVHVGDIFWRPCTDEMYETALTRLNRLPLPVVFTPGDNEWTDCWDQNFDPLERLAHDAAARTRTAAAVAWLRETFAEARKSGAAAVVLAFHASPELTAPADDPYRQAYEPLLATLEAEAVEFGKPVLLLHGDQHELIVDQPLVDRATGQRIANVTRLEVPGSPDVGWVRVTATAGPAPTFSFEARVIDRFKLW